VEIEVVAQESEGHHDAFGVPAGSAFAEGRGPTRLPRFGVLPQREIEWRTLFADGFDAVTGAKAVEWLAGQESVVGDARDVEIDAITDDVGDVVLEKTADQLDHLGTQSVACGASSGRATPSWSIASHHRPSYVATTSASNGPLVTIAR